MGLNGGSRMPTKLPLEDHVVRFVPKNRLRKDADGNVMGVLPQAFQRRDSEQYLSGTWLEHFATDYEQGLIGSAAAIRRQLTVKPRDGFTVGGFGDVIRICDGLGVRVRTLHEPVHPENTGHCAMRGLPRDDLELFSLLADDVLTDTRVAAAVPAPG
jgi:hypothetical protein